MIVRQLWREIVDDLLRMALLLHDDERAGLRTDGAANCSCSAPVLGIGILLLLHNIWSCFSILLCTYLDWISKG
ncbi:unnamed protein product [Fusarium venenatum]|uniref:Uncharacterized protein n=1 Tax=Fusarium venenatum TaxID=56646 RepID=A0A2L2STW1_9HYPO|nr:uncharacterized protein FVRRES_11616 [Fusarium venenatum]CEI38925.1 unnamed protein product [Fusarium venenatum]